MSRESSISKWAARVVDDATFRQTELRQQHSAEVLWGGVSLAAAVLAVWGFTAGTSLGGVTSTQVAGLATLAFVGATALSSHAGSRVRLAEVVDALEGRSFGGAAHDVTR